MNLHAFIMFKKFVEHTLRKCFYKVCKRCKDSNHENVWFYDAMQ